VTESEDPIPPRQEGPPSISSVLLMLARIEGLLNQGMALHLLAVVAALYVLWRIFGGISLTAFEGGVNCYTGPNVGVCFRTEPPPRLEERTWPSEPLPPGSPSPVSPP